MKKWAFLAAMMLLTGSLSIPLSVSATDVPVDTEVATTLTEIQETTETTTSPTITEPIETPSTTEVVASDFFVEPSACNLTVGESCNLNVKFDKEEYDAKRIEYQSADESIATVSEYGLVTAISAGETCIRISVFDEADNTFKTIQIPVVIAPDDTISTEQQEQLAALKEKGNHLFGEFIREEKIILGELPPDTARLCFDDVQEILANNTDFQNIYESLLSIAKYPDFVGGSGVTLVEFWLDDYGTEKILLILEQEDVISVKCNADGNISDWKPLYSEEKAETTATTATTETTTTTATVTSDALSEEQAKALAELAEKEHGVFGEFERARASILNKIPEDASRMTLEEAKEFVNSSDSFKEIYDKLSASQPYPDFIGGSGVTKVEYWFDDKGKEKILLILEQEDVIYVDCTKQGDVSKWERLYPVSDVEDSNIKDSNLAETYKIYNGIEDTVTTESTTTNYKNITQEDFKDWAMKDYATKTGNTPAKAALLETADGNYAITLTDEDGEVLDVYTVNPETATGTNMANEVVSLPQTGYSDIYKIFVGLATLMTVSGVTLIVKTRKKDG
ncbi:MAG: Ig-like domain-containing protein [Ruminococcus sp.]